MGSLRIFIVNQTTMDLLFGIVTGIVLSFIAYKAYQMNKESKSAGTKPTSTGGGYTSGGEFGELPKDNIK